jgi:hypothetical protein
MQYTIEEQERRAYAANDPAAKLLGQICEYRALLLQALADTDDGEWRSRAEELLDSDD